jgi:hypothetical protein
MFKKDDFKFGLLIGFLAPLLSLVAYYFIKFSAFSVWDVLRFLGQNKSQITALSVPCLLLNIGLFTFYVNTNRDKTAKGLFAVTLFFALGTLVVKFLL